MTILTQLPRTILTASRSVWIGAALALILFCPPLGADNASTAEGAERRKAQPLILKIRQDYKIRTPQRGEAKNSVRNRFGPPEAIRGPVGDPPIFRWRYPRFEVVFEKDWVIDTVIRTAVLRKRD